MAQSIKKLNQISSHVWSVGGSNRSCSLHEVAEALSLTRERVRQIEAKALNKIRKKLVAKGINPIDLLN